MRKSLSRCFRCGGFKEARAFSREQREKHSPQCKPCVSTPSGAIANGFKVWTLEEQESWFRAKVGDMADSNGWRVV